MADFNILTPETIDIFALRHYDNRGASKEEFEDDMKRFKYLKRLFRKYDTSKEFKSRLIINHIMVRLLSAMDYMFQYTPANAYRNLYNQNINKLEKEDIYLHYTQIPY